MKVVIRGATQVLAHVPGLVRYGSKPEREKPDFADKLRSFEQAVQYAPHQAYIGAVHPRDMAPRPWTGAPASGKRTGPDGEIMPEEEFLGLLAAVDTAGLL